MVCGLKSRSVSARLSTLQLLILDNETKRERALRVLASPTAKCLGRDVCVYSQAEHAAREAVSRRKLSEPEWHSLFDKLSAGCSGRLDRRAACT